MEPLHRKYCFHCGQQFGVTKETLETHKALFCPLGHRNAVNITDQEEHKSSEPLHVEFKKMRRLLGLSQADVAKEARVSPATISRFERLGEDALTNSMLKAVRDWIEENS